MQVTVKFNLEIKKKRPSDELFISEFKHRMKRVLGECMYSDHRIDFKEFKIVEIKEDDNKA